MSRYCSIEESLGGSLLGNNAMSDGIQIRKHKKKRRHHVPEPFVYSGDQSYCGLDGGMVMSSNALADARPEFYNNGPVERDSIQHSNYVGMENTGLQSMEMYEDHSDMQQTNQLATNQLATKQLATKQLVNKDNQIAKLNKTMLEVLSRLDRLERKINTHSVSPSSSSISSSNIHDIMIYVIIGLFLVFVLDSIFTFSKSKV